MNRKLAVLALALSLAGCPTTNDETGGAGELSDRSYYPGTGFTEGSVIGDLPFKNPDGSPFRLFDIFANPHNRVLFVSTSAGWCTACVEEQPELVKLYADYNDRGLAMLSVYFQDRDGNPASGTEAQQWKDRYGLPFPVVTQYPFHLANYYDQRSTPLAMVIDVDTMEILLATIGFDEQKIRSIIEANLDP